MLVVAFLGSLGTNSLSAGHFSHNSCPLSRLAPYYWFHIVLLALSGLRLPTLGRAGAQQAALLLSDPVSRNKLEQHKLWGADKELVRSASIRGQGYLVHFR